jgi:carbonic anhydrase
MKTSVRLLSLLTLFVILTGFVYAENIPDQGTASLQEGNSRYISGQTLKKGSGDEFRTELAKGQHPFAVIVACSDSRVAPEIIFDQDLGKIFVVRTAGNVVDPIALGSIEYAVEHLHAPLVVVLGHESCGAVKATIESKGEPEGNIGAIVKKIMPAVKRARASLKEGEDLTYRSVVENVKGVAETIRKKSTIIAHEMHEGKVKLVGAYYSISTGKVEAVALK